MEGMEEDKFDKIIKYILIAFGIGSGIASIVLVVHLLLFIIGFIGMLISDLIGFIAALIGRSP